MSLLRVACLYRVSTTAQADHNDIPMQREACQEYAREHGLLIIKEYQERGISAFKTPAEDRDALQKLREDALEKRFDILLVFMFDRIGRRSDETPFVVEWFIKHGIRVISVKEGEQILDSHTDRLLNYIRYWQGEGESKNTSLRIQTRLRQMHQEGIIPVALLLMDIAWPTPDAETKRGSLFRIFRFATKRPPLSKRFLPGLFLNKSVPPLLPTI